MGADVLGEIYSPHCWQVSLSYAHCKYSFSEDRGTLSGLALMQREKTSDAEDRLMQAIMLDSSDDQIIPNLRVQVRSSKRSKL